MTTHMIVQGQCKRHQNQGFTLVELFIAMAVAAILLSVAVPNFSDAMRNSQQSATTNELMGSLRIARSEAIKQSTRTAVCARATDLSCGDDWSNGFIAFMDNGANSGVIDANETILRISPALSSGAWIQNYARLVNTTETPIERPFIRYGPRGESHWRGSGYFLVCDQRGAESTRAINISLSGDPRRARMHNGALVNSFSGTAACPDKDTASE